MEQRPLIFDKYFGVSDPLFRFIATQHGTHLVAERLFDFWAGRCPGSLHEGLTKAESD